MVAVVAIVDDANVVAISSISILKVERRKQESLFGKNISDSLALLGAFNFYFSLAALMDIYSSLSTRISVHVFKLQPA